MNRECYYTADVVCYTYHPGAWCYVYEVDAIGARHVEFVTWVDTRARAKDTIGELLASRHRGARIATTAYYRVTARGGDA